MYRRMPGPVPAVSSTAADRAALLPPAPVSRSAD